MKRYEFIAPRTRHGARRLAAIGSTLGAVALLAVAACHRDKTKSGTVPVPTPNSSSVKPEIDPGSEVSSNGVEDSEASTEDMVTPDFSGTPHDSSCQEDHLGIGMGLLEQGDVDLAISELEKGVFDDPDSFEVRKTLADAYLKKGNLEMAVGHLRAATEQVDDFGTWQKLSQVYFDLKDFDSARTSIVHAAKLDTSSPEPWKLLARVYMSQEMWKESIDASEEAIARGSDSAQTYNGLGFAYLMIGRYDDSVRELEKAVSFDDGVTPQIWNNLGVAYEKSGQLADAAQAYRASLAGNPTYVKAKVNLDRVTEIAKKDSVPVGEEKAQLDKTDLEGKTAPVTGEVGGKTVDPGTAPTDVPVQP